MLSFVAQCGQRSILLPRQCVWHVSVPPKREEHFMQRRHLYEIGRSSNGQMSVHIQLCESYDVCGDDCSYHPANVTERNLSL